MLALLSPAKSLDLTPPSTTLPSSESEFSADAAVLLQIVKGLQAEDLQGLMGISEKLAALNYERFQSMSFPLEQPSSLPAALIFDGDVYKGLSARTLDDSGLAWANEHLRILSGLYGILRPLDLVHPYRLEMGTRLRTPRGASLYTFWGTRLAEKLDADVLSHVDPVIIDLASKEYNRAVPKKALQSERIEIQFKEMREGKARVISFFAKKARGRFARWMVDERVERREELRSFREDGYAYSEALSNSSSWVFIRSS